MLTNLCIYTIKHSDDLRASIAKGGNDTYSERKKWVRAKELLTEAHRAGKRLPVIFAPAEGTFHLFAWALLEDVILGEASRYTFSSLQAFDPQPHKSTLVKESDGKRLDEGFIRPYAICRTPEYLEAAIPTSPYLLPGELDGVAALIEGACRKITVNAYERNPEARRKCIAHWGTACCICTFDFGAVYGKIAEGFIHVHHLRALSEIGAEYEVDPIKDLRPICPNCHAVIHIGAACRSIEEMQRLLQR